MATDLEVGDVVWAKVKGYSWWPGVVITAKNGKK